RLLWVQHSEQLPKTRAAHRALETHCFVEHRAVLRFAPSVRLEELGILRRREFELSVSRLNVLPPHLAHHLEQPWTRDIEQPPLKARLRVQIVGERRDMRGLEIDQQAFGYD